MIDFDRRRHFFFYLLAHLAMRTIASKIESNPAVPEKAPKQRAFVWTGQAIGNFCVLGGLR